MSEVVRRAGMGKSRMVEYVRKSSTFARGEGTVFHRENLLAKHAPSLTRGPTQADRSFSGWVWSVPTSLSCLDDTSASKMRQWTKLIVKDALLTLIAEGSGSANQTYAFVQACMSEYIEGTDFIEIDDQAATVAGAATGVWRSILALLTDDASLMVQYGERRGLKAVAQEKEEEFGC